jgi:hypothetical protein
MWIHLASALDLADSAEQTRRRRDAGESSRPDAIRKETHTTTTRTHTQKSQSGRKGEVEFSGVPTDWTGLDRGGTVNYYTALRDLLSHTVLIPQQ